MLPRDAISAAINAAKTTDHPALIAYLTAGFPSPTRFVEVLQQVAQVADAIEVGVPFTDPMADGLTIQRSSRVALQHGVTLPWILDVLQQHAPTLNVPVLLMSYLNPLLAFGLERLPQQAAVAGVAGFIVPDLPLEESVPLRAALDTCGLALVQMVTPVTPAERLSQLCQASQGFIYAVTMTGTTGKQVAVPPEVLAYMDRVVSVASIPVCAGFGIRTREQVQRMVGHVHGVVVGSALVEVLERNEDPVAFLQSLCG